MDLDLVTEIVRRTKNELTYRSNKYNLIPLIPFAANRRETSAIKIYMGSREKRPQCFRYGAGALYLAAGNFETDTAVGGRARCGDILAQWQTPNASYAGGRGRLADGGRGAQSGR